MGRPPAAVFARLARFAAVGEGRPSRTVAEVFTGDALGEVPVGTAADVTTAFEAARRAQPAWEALGVRARGRILSRFADLVHERRDLVLDVIQAETGKARFSALEEVLDAMLAARFFAARGPGWLASRRVAGAFPLATKAVVHHPAVGVVGVIAPWNYPLTLAIGDALPALMAGSAVVIKPDSQTPYSALLGAELLAEAGLPPDVLSVVPGPGAEVGTAIADTCDYLMFTGSTATGRELGARIGRRLVGWSAELGGKNAMIVGVGADLRRVAEIATRALFSNAGQLCISIERIYVVREIAAEFTDILTRRVAAMRLGPGYTFGVEMGSLISPTQLETVRGAVADAVAKGARVLTGGRPRPDLGPLFYEPTLLADVPPEARCYAEETFGPVASLYPVSDLDEAVRRANDTIYGLNSAVFCATRREGESLTRRLRTGTVNVDEGYAPAWGSLGAPMGGMGASGVGRRHGREGLLKYTQPQTVATQRWVHLGGPSFLVDRWPDVLERAANVMRFLPGR